MHTFQTRSCCVDRFRFSRKLALQLLHQPLSGVHFLGALRYNDANDKHYGGIMHLGVYKHVRAEAHMEEHARAKTQKLHAPLSCDWLLATARSIRCCSNMTSRCALASASVSFSCSTRFCAHSSRCVLSALSRFVCSCEYSFARREKKKSSG